MVTTWNYKEDSYRIYTKGNGKGIKIFHVKKSKTKDSNTGNGGQKKL